MPRIRSIKPEFFTSEQVADLSPTARLLFVGTWVFADDGGIHPWSPKRLKMEVFPGDEIAIDDVEAMLIEIENAGLLQSYWSGGTRYFAINGWKHQKIEKPHHKYPGPEMADNSTTDRRPIDDRSTTIHPRIGEDRKGKDRRGKEIKEVSGRLRRSTAFVKPTIADVAAYCLERGSKVSPQQWYDHYESNGWRVGKNPMKDWKACVRKWEASEYGNGKSGRGTTSHLWNSPGITYDPDAKLKDPGHGVM